MLLQVVDLYIFINDSSRYMDICLMRRKSGAFEIIRKVFKNEVEVIVTRKIIFLQFDCTKEYLSYMFSECLMSCERGFITCTSWNTTASEKSVEM